MDAMTDAELIAKYRGGESIAYDMLVSRYLKLVYSIAFRFVGQREAAEDISQDVFLKALQSLNSFDVSRDFKPWIVTITKNQARDWLKKKNPVLLAEMSEEAEYTLLESLPDTSPSAETETDLAIRSNALDAAIKELTPEQQRIIFLRYIKDFSFKEIADEIGQIANTVKTKHFRALAALRKIVTKSATLSE